MGQSDTDYEENLFKANILRVIIKPFPCSGDITSNHDDRACPVISFSILHDQRNGHQHYIMK